ERWTANESFGDRFSTPPDPVTSAPMSFRETQRGRPEHAREPGSQVTPGRAAAVGSLILVGVVTAVILLGSGSHKHPTTATSSTPASTHGPGASTSRATPA